MWTIFKVFIEFVTVLLLFYVLVFWWRGMWDLSSPTRDWTHTPCTARQSLNHWTTMEVPNAAISLLEIYPEEIIKQVYKNTNKCRASLVAQWLRIRLPMQGTRVWGLVREDPICHGATKPMCHNYWACVLEPVNYNYWAREPQLLKPTHLEPMLRNKRSHRNEKPSHHNKE